jgi:hypothetical protein
MVVEAEALKVALDDANRRWPGRNKLSDGIQPDARHQAEVSDHNLGNALDLTHDPAHGCDGAVVAEMAILDPRVTYVIFNRRIYNRGMTSAGWRLYTREDPHTNHVHMSIAASSRDDTSAWGWAPESGDIPATTVAADDALHPAPTGIYARWGRLHAEAYPGVAAKLGSHGEVVRRVQQRLKDLGWTINVTGKFEADTDAVVKLAQARFGITPADGVVGRNTWKAFFALS